MDEVEKPSRPAKQDFHDGTTTERDMNNHPVEVHQTDALGRNLVLKPWKSKLYFITEPPYPHLKLLLSVTRKKVQGENVSDRCIIRITKEGLMKPSADTITPKDEVDGFSITTKTKDEVRGIVSQEFYKLIHDDQSVQQITVHCKRKGNVFESIMNASAVAEVAQVRQAVIASEFSLTFYIREFEGKVQADFTRLTDAFKEVKPRIYDNASPEGKYEIGKYFDEFFEPEKCKRRIGYEGGLVDECPSYCADAQYSFASIDHYLAVMYIGHAQETAFTSMMAPTKLVMSKVILLDAAGYTPHNITPTDDTDLPIRKKAKTSVSESAMDIYDEANASHTSNEDSDVGEGEEEYDDSDLVGDSKRHIRYSQAKIRDKTTRSITDKVDKMQVDSKPVGLKPVDSEETNAEGVNATQSNGETSDAVSRTTKSKASDLSRAHLVLIPRPDPAKNPEHADELAHFRLSVGDKISVTFNPPDNRVLWEGKILDAQPFTPRGFWTAFIYRPWDKEKWDWKDETKHASVDIESLGSLAITKETLATSTAVSVGYNITHSDKISKNIKYHITNLNMRMHCVESQTNTKYEPTPILTRNFQVLLNNDPHALEVVDAYAKLREEFGDVKKCMAELDPSQKKVIDTLSAAAGGWTHVQGPPGSGKTWIIIQAIKPFFMSEENHGVLLISTSNNGANDICAKAKAALEEAQANDNTGALQGKYGLRVHSMSTEKTIALRQEKLKRGKPEGAKPESYQEPSTQVMDLLEELEMARISHSMLVKEQSTTHELVYDKRVGQDITMSLGHVMMQMIFMIPGGPRAEGSWATLRKYLQDYGEGNEFSADDMKEMGEHLARLREYTIANAAFIVCTHSAAGQDYIGKFYRPELICMDEITRCSEPDLIPTLSCYDQCPSWVLVGDTNQLLPVVHTANLRSDEGGHNFSEQVRLSIAHRLQASKFPNHVLLRTQHRATPALADIYSSAIYDSMLQNGDTTSIEQRPIAAAAREFNKDKFKIESEIVALDVTSSYEAQANANHSTYNEENVCISVNLLEQILSNENIMKDRPLICIATPYEAQYHAYMSAIPAIKAKFPAFADRIHCDKVDGLQGAEFDIVICDMTITSRAGFLKDKGRLNVFFSRAKNAQYVIANFSKVAAIDVRNLKYLKEFYNEYRKFAVPAPADWATTSAFYSHGQVIETIDLADDKEDEVQGGGNNWANDGGNNGQATGNW